MTCCACLTCLLITRVSTEDPGEYPGTFLTPRCPPICSCPYSGRSMCLYSCRNLCFLPLPSSPSIFRPPLLPTSSLLPVSLHYLPILCRQHPTMAPKKRPASLPPKPATRRGPKPSVGQTRLDGSLIELPDVQRPARSRKLKPLEPDQDLITMHFKAGARPVLSAPSGADNLAGSSAIHDEQGLSSAGSPAVQQSQYVHRASIGVTG